MKIPVAENLIRRFTHKDIGALQTRTLMLWLATYPKAHEQQLFSKDELKAEIVKQSGVYEDRIIKTAVDLKLFTKGKRFNGEVVYHRTGKDEVYKLYLDGNKPGILIYIDAADIKEDKLKRLRGVLHHTFAAAKPRIRSRAVQADISGYTEQTTRNWSRVLKDDGDLYVKPNHYTAKSPFSGNVLVVSQAPNTYIPNLYAVRDDNPQRAWDDNSRRNYVPDKPPVNLRHAKRYFNSEADAKKAWDLRQRKTNSNPHFMPRDTFFPEIIEADGRTYNGLRRVRPHSVREIPEDIMVADELAYEYECRQWEASLSSVAKPQPSSILIKKMFNLTHDKLPKPKRIIRERNNNIHHHSLSYEQQLELALRPELMIIAQEWHADSIVG